MPYKGRYIEAPRFVNSPEFLQSSLANPFDDPRYKTIPYPLRLGNLTREIDAIANHIQQDMEENQLRSYYEEFEMKDDFLIPARFNFMQDIVKKIVSADYYLYVRNKPCEWSFDINAAYLEKDQVLLPASRNPHVDFLTTSERIEEAFSKKPNGPFPGLLNYAVANIHSPKFPGKKRFPRGELLHWGYTKHLSPTVPKSCFRVLVAGRPAMNWG